ncbi:MAG TPA: C4-dicarboxylate ABC transporter [Geobacter sp.]|nr:C4-dicarboxylate ABC transporter [Geobacter sp.]
MKLKMLVVALLSLSFAAAASAAQPIVIKFSHVVAVDTPKGQAAAYFKKIAEERTKGRVKIDIYPNSQLFKDKEELEALQLGSVHMLAPATSKFGPMGAKQFELFELPYVFDSYDEVHKVAEGAVGKQLLRSLDSKGITGLAFWDNGFRCMSANKKIVTPNDMRGLKMRISSSKGIDAYMRQLGSVPQVMSFGEVYQAMQTGVVDGAENSPSNFYTQKMHEVQKYYTNTNHSYSGYAVIVNKKFWDGLPKEIRGTLEQALRDATAYNNKIAAKDNDESLAKVKKTGKTQVIDLTPEQKKSWKKAMLPAHKKMEDKIGKDLINAVYRETGFNPTTL